MVSLFFQSERKHIMFKKFIIALLATLFAVTLSACGTTAPQTWDGSWKADGFSATIQNNVIDIHIVSKDGTDALYWNGTFAPNSKTVDSESVNSVRDFTLTEHALFASQDSTKVFEAKDGNLHFHMSMMGVSRDVTLTKASN
jgi:hypothetical protein